MHDNVGPSGGYMIDLNDASDDVWRNYFAGQALAIVVDKMWKEGTDKMAEMAYCIADAMMEERKSMVAEQKETARAEGG